MTWTSSAPIGTLSVKANRPILSGNMNYIENTMGNISVANQTLSPTLRDHFWNVSSDNDGRHRFIQSPAFTVGGSPADPDIGTGMDSVTYTKTSNGTAQGFFRNSANIYQYIPNYLTGTHAVTSSITNMVTVPDNTYGEIFMYRTGSGNNRGQTGFFKAQGGICNSWSHAINNDSGGNDSRGFALLFSNGSQSSGLNIRVKRNGGSNANWTYIVTYRAM